jgi:alanine-glyoxylate transaminase/serine-glyoxylate transaminase/serine-pyruvate transaminase
MLLSEGLDRVVARHERLAEATRRRGARVGPGKSSAPIQAEFSAALTTVMMPDGHKCDTFRKIALDRFNLSLGQGLGKLSGKVFRIRPSRLLHMKLMLCGTLCGVEMGLALAAVPHRKGGVQAATDYPCANGGNGLARAA